MSTFHVAGNANHVPLEEDENGNLLVPPSATALIYTENGNFELSIPYDSGSNVSIPGGSLLLAAVAKLVTDESWADSTIQRVFPDAKAVGEDMHTEGEA